jgi:hypothetical protein
MSKAFTIISTSLGIVVACLVMVVLPTQRQYYPSSRSQRSGEHEQPTGTTRSTLKDAHAPTVSQIAADRDTTQKERDLTDWITSERVMAASAIVQAVSAAIMVGFTLSLLKYTQRTWKVGVRNARAAKRSADAANKSANAAIRALALSHRPWLEITDWVVQLFPTEEPDKSTVIVQFTLRNTSEAPAMILSLRATAPGCGNLPHAPSYDPTHLMAPHGVWKPYGIGFCRLTNHQLDQYAPDISDRPQFKPLAIVVEITYADRIGSPPYVRSSKRLFMFDRNRRIFTELGGHAGEVVEDNDTQWEKAGQDQPRQ